MRRRLTALIVCPACGRDLNLETHAKIDYLACPVGHRFPIVAGVPRLLTTTLGADAQSIAETFGHQWNQFDYDQDRTWGRSAPERLRIFLNDIGEAADWLKGKTVLDAGCGNGVLSHAVSTIECDVLATDISESVSEAHRRFADSENLLFVQSDLLEPAFRPSSFDVIYSGGVLHHTRSTREALECLVPTLKPGGIIYIWLYWRVPGHKYQIRSMLRRMLAPLPTRAKHIVVLPLVAFVTLRGIGTRESKSWRENLLVELDFFTPRYRWEHTPDEVHEWFRAMGFVQVETRSQTRDGFGVLAQAPG